MRRLVLASIILTCLSANACRDAAPTPTQPTTSTPPTQTTPSSPPTAPQPPAPPPSATPPPGGEVCAAIRKETGELLRSPEAMDLSCSTNADCGCAPAIINCGGVFRKPIAKQLSELGQRRADNDCGYYSEDGSSQFNCAPWACEPQCVQGACRK